MQEQDRLGTAEPSQVETIHLTQIEPTIGGSKDGTKKQDTRWFLKSWSSWQKVVAMIIIFNIIALIFNCVLLIWAKTKPRSAQEGYIIWQGSVKSIQWADTLLHLLINIISTTILAGGNYTSQVLISPTRDNINQAHSENRSLDVGISSFKNWPYLSQRRKLLYVCVLSVTLPIHLVYNSIIVSNIVNVNGPSNVVTKDFLEIAPGHAFLNDVWHSARNNSWTNMTLEDCVDASKPVIEGSITEYSNFLWFANISSVLQNSSWFYAGPITSGSLADPYSVCTYSTPLPDGGYVRNTTFVAPGTWLTSTSPITWMESMSQGDIDPDSASQVLVCIDSNTYNHPLDSRNPLYEYVQGSAPAHLQYCLAESAYLSTIELVPQSLVVIIICNILSIGALFLLFFSIFDPIINIGDAISSFLNEPDLTNRGLGSVSITETQQQRSAENLGCFAKEKQSTTSQHYYFNSATNLRWFLTLIPCVFYCLVSTGLASREQDPDAGSGEPYAFLGAIFSGRTISSSSMTLIGSILLTNTPQLALSSIHLSFNGLLTCMSSFAEWMKYSQDPTSLRVSKPEGEQRTAYFLSLSHKYSVMLAMVSVLLHWILSQSIFTHQITSIMYSGSDGAQRTEDTLTAFAMSRMGLYTGSIIAGGLILGSVALGFRQLESSMPLARNNSRTISAACHSDPMDSENPATKKLQYTVISRLPSGRYRTGSSDDETQPLTLYNPST